MKARYNLLAFAVIGILGAISHFAYEWSGANRFVGYFFAVNESTWEHLKLLFFPTAFYSIIEYIFVKKEIKNYVPATVISVIAGRATIVILFYTYQGVLGYTIDFLNIVIYYIGLIIMLVIRNKIIDSEILSDTNPSLIFLLIAVLIAFMFVRFTYLPPNLNIFTPPMIEKWCVI